MIKEPGEKNSNTHQQEPNRKENRNSSVYHHAHEVMDHSAENESEQQSHRDREKFFQGFKDELSQVKAKDGIPVGPKSGKISGS